MLLVIMVRRGGLRGLKLTWSMIIMDHKSLWEFRSMPFIETFLCTSIMFLRPPSLPSVGLKSCKEICFQYFSYFFHEFFFIAVLFWKAMQIFFQRFIENSLHSLRWIYSETVWFLHCYISQYLHFPHLHSLNAFCLPK